jgi:hypothetical protein
MLAPWVIEEMKAVDLDDKRLNKRLQIVLSQLAERPAAGIPAACGGWAEMTAAYRFFDNEKATFDGILGPHFEASRKRIDSQPIAILAQDTTEIDLTRPEQPVAGAGPLDGAKRRGALLHAMHAFTPDGTPLGAVSASAWSRPEEAGCASLTRAQRAATPIHEKESRRWVNTFVQARQLAKQCPTTQCVCVADSEADIYELLVEATAEPRTIDWIVRACQNRALQPAENETEPAHLRECVSAGPVLFTQMIQVRGRKAKTSCETRGRRQPRESRAAEVAVRAVRVTLRPPWRSGCKLPAVTVNVVLVREEHPPAGDEPVEWLLLTSLPITDAEQVRQVIQYYSVRWMIEVFFRVLKSGCRIEQRRFEALDRLLTCLAVYLIVTWRTLYTCRLGRNCPGISCEAIFEPAEWKAVWKVVRQEELPLAPPALEEMIDMVAQLGGYVPRKDSAPGPQTVWLGMQRVHDFALCWKKFGPEVRNQIQLV